MSSYLSYVFYISCGVLMFPLLFPGGVSDQGLIQWVVNLIVAILIIVIVALFVVFARFAANYKGQKNRQFLKSFSLVTLYSEGCCFVGNECGIVAQPFH